MGLLLLFGCGGSPPESLGPSPSGLRECPAAPNCVHTGDGHPADVLPFVLTDEWVDRPTQETWDAVEAAVASLTRTEVVTRTEGYLHAESTSAVFRFVDDLEVYRAAESPEIVVRSEARVGRSDMGVNMRRVESLRQALQAQGVIR